MVVFPSIYTFEQAMEIAKNNHENKLCTKSIRLLLGNGFSQAYHGDFAYSTLFDSVKQQKENARIKNIFEHFGTSNFEGVLSFLKKVQVLSTIYNFDMSEVVSDYERVRDALADAVVKVHPEKTTEISDLNKNDCYKFIDRFDDVYTVNYDLLLYWVLLRDSGIDFGDYFFRDEETPQEYCEYVEDGGKTDKHIYYLHGALHLFLKNGITTKKVWGNTIPLISQIKDEMEQGYYPLVVAEGESADKIEQIKGNPYLNHSFSKFERGQGQLFTFGFSFSSQDAHITKAIIKNRTLKYLWIGIRGDFTEDKNKQLFKMAEDMVEQRRNLVGLKDKKGNGYLTVNFFDAGEMDIWGKKFQ